MLTTALVLAVPLASEAAEPTLASTMTDARVDESSSLAVSRDFPGIAYTANDENDPVFTVEISTGRIVGTTRLVTSSTSPRRVRVWVPKPKLAANAAVTCQTKKQRNRMCKKAKRWMTVNTPINLVDPESMATDTAGVVWLADTGDNDLQRHGGDLYAFAEPGGGDKAVVATRYPIVYPGGASVNVEALLINPITNAKYLVSKNMTGNGRLFGLPATLTPNAPNLAVDLGIAMPQWVSDGDFSPQGTRVVLRDGTPGSTTAHVLAAATWQRLGDVQVPNAPEGKGESVSFDGTGPRFLTSREGTDAPLFWVPFDEATWRN